MHKKELIDGLFRFVDSFDITGKVRWKGQKTFARFLIWYLKNLNIPTDEKYDFYRIEPYLPELMVDAFEQLRTSSDERVIAFRKLYEAETEHEVPNITDLGESSIFDQCMAVQTTLGFILKEITGLDWLEQKIDTYCNAQKHVLQQTFDKFLRLVYRRGMYEIIDTCKKSGMSGKFDATELRTFITAGRIMFTFARRKKGETIYRGLDGKVIHHLPYREDSVSFVGEDDDPLCLSAGLQSIHVDFRTALDLIEDVVRHWPSDPKEQTKIYKADEKVSIM